MAKPYLLVKRYDRIEMSDGIKRLHQEDFCQALDIIPEMKYQREGGLQLADCFNLIRRASSLPVMDIKALLQGVLFNLIIGNNDAHGKNFSLLYQASNTRLAPFYDLISTVYYPNLASKMAMDAKLSKNLVQKEMLNMLNKIETHLIDSPYSATIWQRIEQLTRRFQ